MEERLKICPNCTDGICLVTWKFCANCGSNVENVEPKIVKYSFIDGNNKILESIMGSLSDLVNSKDSFVYMLRGLLIVKFFEVNLASTIAFVPLAIYKQSSTFKSYVQTNRYFFVFPPTK